MAERMWRERRLKPADFYEKSPVFSQKHGGFLWKVGDLNFAEGVAVGVGDSGKSEKPNRQPMEASFCRINVGFLTQNEGRVAVFRSLSEPAMQGLSIAVGKEASRVLGVDFQRTMSGESDRPATKKRQSPRGDCRMGKSVAPVRRAMCGGWIYFVSKTGAMRLRST